MMTLTHYYSFIIVFVLLPSSALPVCTAQHCLLVVLSFQTFALPKCLLGHVVCIFSLDSGKKKYTCVVI